MKHTKKLYSIILLTAMSMTLSSRLTANAEDMYTDDKIVYLYVNGSTSDALTLDYDKDKNNTSITGTLTIPSSISGHTVTGIDMRGFYNCMNLESVVIPETITKIGTEAFFNCPKLNSVTLPKSLTKIDDNAFMSCDKLTDVYYSGSQEDFEKIDIVGMGNYAISYANIHFAASSSSGASAASSNDISVLLNQNRLSFDVPPQIINDRTMVPLRAIFEALGATVNWDDSTKTVTSSKGGTTISLTINSSSMYVNGKAVSLDSPACIVDGRTLVPVRAISEAYGTTVNWDGGSRTVTITSNNPGLNSGTDGLGSGITKNDNSGSFSSPVTTPAPSGKIIGGIELNHEYGPMRVESRYSDGSIMHWNDITSLVFTSCEMTSIGKYKVYMNMKGKTDHNYAKVVVHFYDSAGNAIGKETFLEPTEENAEYNLQVYAYVEQEVINNAVRIEFFSSDGRKATKGNTDTSSADTAKSTSKTAKTAEKMSRSEAFKDFKDQLSELGMSVSSGYITSTTSGNTSINCSYSKEKDVILVILTNKTTDMTIGLNLYKKDDPTIVYGEKSLGKSFVYSGTFVNSKLEKDISNFPLTDSEIESFILMELSSAERSLSSIGYAVSFENFGIKY